MLRAMNRNRQAANEFISKISKIREKTLRSTIVAQVCPGLLRVLGLRIIHLCAGIAPCWMLPSGLSRRERQLEATKAGPRNCPSPCRHTRRRRVWRQGEGQFQGPALGSFQLSLAPGQARRKHPARNDSCAQMNGPQPQTFSSPG
jgi:hypothetical protein